MGVWVEKEQTSILHKEGHDYTCAVYNNKGLINTLIELISFNSYTFICNLFLPPSPAR